MLAGSSKKRKKSFDPHNLDVESIAGYKAFLLEQDARPKTVNRRLASLAKYAHWAIQTGILTDERNPLQEISTVKDPNPAPRILDSEEQKQLLQAIEFEVNRAMLRYPRLRISCLRDFGFGPAPNASRFARR